MSKIGKKSVKKPTKKTTKVVKTKSTGNKELDKMLVTLNAAKKAGEKKVVVFTTNKSHHKASTSNRGCGLEDLKPKIQEAYKHLVCKYNVGTNLLAPMEVQWIVKL